MRKSEDFERVIVDPSAASFIACIRRHGRYWVEPAKNGVLEGIQLTAAMLNEGRIRFCSGCADSIRDLGSIAGARSREGSSL